MNDIISVKYSNEMHKSIFSAQYNIFPLDGWVYSTVLILFSDIQPDQNIWDNLQQVFGIHCRFEEFALGDDNVELEPEQDNDDDPNNDLDDPT